MSEFELGGGFLVAKNAIFRPLVQVRGTVCLRLPFFLHDAPGELSPNGTTDLQMAESS